MSDLLTRAKEISHCHHCFKQLMYKKGGSFSFAEVVHPDGHRVRVHHQCREYILGDGYTLPPEEKRRGR